MRRPLALALLALALGLAPALSAGGARAQDLVADVSDHLIAITTGFTGTDILVFGSVEASEGATADIVIVVRGPSRPVKLFRKAPVLGVWLNSASLTFPQAPSFYAYAASGALEQIAEEPERKRLQLGLEQVELKPQSPVSGNLLAEWRGALLDARARQGLYAFQPGRVTRLGDRLFRASITLPTNVPVGTYLVEAYLFENGIAVAAQTIPLVVSKVGFEADIFTFAHRQSALYGIGAILVALLAGWGAHLLFRRH